MNRLLFLFAFLLLPLAMRAQMVESAAFKGTIGTFPITLYFQAQTNECTADTAYYGMYKYDGKSEWLHLNMDANTKKQFVLVEHGFTGVLMVTRRGDVLEGTWYSPDRKKTLPVKLRKQGQTPGELKKMEDVFEKLSHDLFDC